MNAWCCDSALSTLSTLPGQPLYDFITAQRARPTAWLRYLCEIPGYSDGLTTAEVAFLHDHGCAVGCIYNRTSAASVTGTSDEGYAAAQEAINLLAALHTPLLTDVAIYLDIEAGFAPNPEFLRGWNANLHRAGLIAGTYCNPENPQHAQAYLTARDAAPAGRYAVWSSEPEPAILWDTVHTAFAPGTALLGAHAADCGLWQYSEDSFRQYNGGLVDFNVATEVGLATLWGPVPVPPADPYTVRGATWHVVTRSGLKTEPTHESPLAIDPARQPVVLTPGATVTSTGAVTPHWVKVTLPAPSPVWGWLLKESLRA